MCERWSWKSFVSTDSLVRWLALLHLRSLGMGRRLVGSLGLKPGLVPRCVGLAGSGVVHAMGANHRLGRRLCIGPRRANTSMARPGHSGHPWPWWCSARFLLALGWWASNAGSTLSGRISVATVVVNTHAGARGGAIATIFTLRGDWDSKRPTMMCKGMLAGTRRDHSALCVCRFISRSDRRSCGGWCAERVLGNTIGIDDVVGAVSVQESMAVGRHLGGLIRNGSTVEAGAALIVREMKALYGSDGVRGLF